MDQTASEQIELIAKELYCSFADFYNAKSWVGYPSWNQLGDATKGFWISMVKVISFKVSRLDEEEITK